MSVNGAGAHLTDIGDELIICSYIQLDESMETLPLRHTPKIKIIDPKDRIYRELLGLDGSSEKLRKHIDG